MKQFYTGVYKAFSVFGLTALLSFCMQQQVLAQASTSIKDYVIFGGWNGAGGVVIGNSVNITGNGALGSQRLVRSTGIMQLTGSIFSGGQVDLAGNNRITGRIAAASGTGNLVQAASGLNLTGNIDAQGNVNIVSPGTVNGRVTVPVGFTYTGPAPTLGSVNGIPSIPTLPRQPKITDLTKYAPVPSNSTTNITTNRTITPGVYHNMTLTGNRTVTFSGPGVYVFNSIKNSGNFNTFVYDFKNTTTGDIIILVRGDVDLFKLEVRTINGGSPARIYAEVQGTGSTAADGVSSWIHSNGTSGSKNSGWLGAVWAPYGNILMGFGPQNSYINGSLMSGRQVTLQSGVNLSFTPYSWPNEFDPIQPQYPFPVNGKTAATRVSTELIILCAPGNENLLTNLSAEDPLRDIYLVEGSGATTGVYIEAVATSQANVATLRSILVNNYSLTKEIPNEDGSLKVTGLVPVNKVCGLETDPALSGIVADILPLYPPARSMGAVATSGDISMATNQIRESFGLQGEGIKVGVISDTYNKRAASLGSTVASDIASGDLPGSENPVIVLGQQPSSGTDEGRAMLQIVYDIVPRPSCISAAASIMPVISPWASGNWSMPVAR